MNQYLKCEDCNVESSSVMERFDGILCETCVKFFKRDREYKDYSLPNERKFGIEIETSNNECLRRSLKLNKLCPKWVFSNDCSLERNGVEFKSDILSYPSGIEDVVALLKVLNKDNFGQFNVTDKCGLHIHISLEDFNYTQIYRLIKLWCRIEDDIFKLVSERRKGLHFCYEVSKSQTFYKKRNKFDPKEFQNYASLGKYKLLSYMFGPNYVSQQWYRDKRVSNFPYRYGSLNVHQLINFKIAEIRLHHGTLKIHEICHWLDLWVNVFSYLKTQKFWNRFSLKDLIKESPCKPSTKSHYLSKLDVKNALIKDQLTYSFNRYTNSSYPTF